MQFENDFLYRNIKSDAVKELFMKYESDGYPPMSLSTGIHNIFEFADWCDIHIHRPDRIVVYKDLFFKLYIIYQECIQTPECPKKQAISITL